MHLSFSAFASTANPGAAVELEIVVAEAGEL
jgi:hypothetical protein